jgi:hypothetical protein
MGLLHRRTTGQKWDVSIHSEGERITGEKDHIESRYKQNDNLELLSHHSLFQLLHLGTSARLGTMDRKNRPQLLYKEPRTVLH